MSEYLTFFSSYFNVLSIIWGGIKIGLLSFIVALVLLIVLKKFVLIRRSYKAIQCLAYSYYFFIPIICLCCGFIYGSIVTSRDELIDKLLLYQTSIQSIIDKNFNVDLIITNYTDKSLNSTLDDAVEEVHASMIAKLKLTNENQDRTQQLVIMLLESPVGMRYMKSCLKDNISSTVGLNRQLVDEVFEIKLSTLFTGDTIIKIFSFYIQQIVNGFLLTLLVIWGGLLFIPLIEIMMAYYYHKRYLLAVKQLST